MVSSKTSQNEKMIGIKRLWDDYEKENKNEAAKEQIIKTLKDWEGYKEKIEEDSLTLDEYTNRKDGQNNNSTLPSEYLCNFLENGSSVFGSIFVGNATYFCVKLNEDGSYFVKGRGRVGKPNKIRAEEYYKDNILPLFRHIVTNESPEVLKDMKEKFDDYTSKVTLMKLAVLSHPTEFVHIYSKGVLKSIYQKYIGKDDEKKNIMEINKAIFEKFREGFNIDISSGGCKAEDIYKIVQLSKFLWDLEDPDFKQFADKESPNMIFYGAPGTGKTYTVKKNIEYLCEGNSSRYEYVQFHPSFTYEDFIDGIKPNGIDDKGGVKLELVNGVFKSFCIRAKKDPDNNYYFIVDEINRANLSAVFGETLSLLESSYRHKVSKNSDDNAEAIGENLISTQYSALLDSLIAKDEKKYKHLAYEIIEDDEGNKHSKFGVPDNVFFIGMMNDVDKSIDAFDLALRRRFKWIHKGYDEKVLISHCKHNDKDFSNIEEYAKCASALNKYIAEDLGLGLSYEFGHSFFMKISSIANPNQQDITEKNLKDLFELYLRPTLQEYLRAFYSESEIEKKLKEALDVFKKPLVNKSSKGADQSEANSSD